jgi:imidazolonepropionase-like amidohydrolase
MRDAPSVTALRLPPTVLPDGDTRDLWVADCVFTTTPQDGAETLPGRYALPGLVDAHAHLTIDMSGTGLAAGGDALVAANLRAQRDAGVLLVRDIGRVRDEALRIHPDEPAVEQAGRFLGPENGWVEGLHVATPPERVLDTVHAQVASGVRWIKVVGDWRDDDGGPRLNYEPALLREVSHLAHSLGVRLAVHAIGAEAAQAAVACGADSVEHGFALDADLLATMAANGTAWTPTLSALTKTDGDEAASRRRQDAIDRVRATLPHAVALGVPVLAGTDTVAHGSIAAEVALLVEFGLDPVEALRSATTTARTFLGAPGIEDGAPADVVTYDADPREDPEVLRTPAAVVRRGVRVR